MDNSASRRPRRILVIDDDPDTVEVLTMILRTAGHRVRSAVDGESGLELARSFLPEVLVCDVRLPDVNGLEVARAIKSDPSLSSCYVIAVSGLNLSAMVRSSAVDETFQKPVSPETLVAAVDRAG